MYPIADPTSDAGRPAPHPRGPSIRAVMLGLMLALAGVIEAGALLHPAPPAAMVASNTTLLR